MVWKGCERSVITYSSLISACEKAGQWELALELFNEMHQEGCLPNTVTFNSLITACAQGLFDGLPWCSWLSGLFLYTIWMGPPPLCTAFDSRCSCPW